MTEQNAARRRRRSGGGEDHGGGGHEAAGMSRWLLTYSDMITLLLALFVILFALSSINQKKFVEFKEGLVHAFTHVVTVEHGGTGLLHQNSLVNHPANSNSTYRAAIPKPTNPALSMHSSEPGGTLHGAQPGSQPLPVIQAAIARALAAKGLSQYAQIIPERRGVVVRVLADKVFYATDHASLSPLGDEVVDTIASVISQDTNNVAVEGYTDSAPIVGGPYSSNWELSAMRAVNVVLRLIRVDHINENRLQAIGYGKTRPVVPNTTPANMALNRRIDVVILAPGRGRI